MSNLWEITERNQNYSLLRIVTMNSEDEKKHKSKIFKTKNSSNLRRQIERIVFIFGKNVEIKRF